MPATATPLSPAFRALSAVSFSLLILACWSLMHRYQGLGYDAQLYAFQALAQIHPALKLDLFLQHSSQDRYSLFSPFYATFIRLWGLEHAALVLTIFFKACLLTAAWHIIRRLKDADTAISVSKPPLTVKAISEDVARLLNAR